MKSRNFRELRVWQLGKKIALDIYRITERFPGHEQYGLNSQMRRAAISIPSNIAEGFNRIHNKEYRNFLFISLGSCAELETQLEIASELNYISVGDKEKMLEDVNYESRMLRKLAKML